MSKGKKSEDFGLYCTFKRFKRPRRKYNNKSDDKYNNTNINATQGQLESTRGQKWKQKENNKDNNK